MAISRTIPSTSRLSAGNGGTLADPDWQLDGDVDFRNQTGNPNVAAGVTFNTVDAWGNTVPFTPGFNRILGSGTAVLSYTAKGITLSGGVGAPDGYYSPEADCADFFTQGPAFDLRDDILIVLDVYDQLAGTYDQLGPSFYVRNASGTTLSGTLAWLGTSLGRLQGAAVYANSTVGPPIQSPYTVSIAQRAAGIAYREWLAKGTAFAVDALTLANYRTELNTRIGGSAFTLAEGTGFGGLDAATYATVGPFLAVQPGNTYNPSIARIRGYRRRAALA